MTQLEQLKLSLKSSRDEQNARIKAMHDQRLSDLLWAYADELLAAAEIGVKWQTNSALEEWFPITAEELAQAKRSAKGWEEDAARFCRNEFFYRGIIVSIGEKFGKAAYTSDDGSVRQDVLCLKVPELVGQLQKDYNELLFAVARKFPDETRHQTALRYIQEAERNCVAAGQYQNSEPK